MFGPSDDLVARPEMTVHCTVPTLAAAAVVVDAAAVDTVADGDLGGSWAVYPIAPHPALSNAPSSFLLLSSGAPWNMESGMTAEAKRRTGQSSVGSWIENPVVQSTEKTPV